MTKSLFVAIALLSSSYALAGAGRTEPKRCREIVFKTQRSNYKDALKLHKEFEDLKCPPGPYKPMVDPSLTQDCKELAKGAARGGVTLGMYRSQMIALDCH